METLSSIGLSKAGLALTLLVGCGQTPPGVKANMDGGGGSHEGDSETERDAEVDESECSDGDTRSCPCGDGGVGKATCDDGEFGACAQCSYDVPSKCIPGAYEGHANGMYRSGAAGIPGFVAPFAGPDNSRWTLYLEPPEAGEFSTVGRGCVHVLPPADAGATEGSEGRFFLNGELDCSTGKFVGEGRGYYDASSLGGTNRYYYKGRFKGTFDPASKSFIDTAYDVREPAVLIGEQPGGQGMFELKFTGTEPPEDRSDQAGCVSSEFPADSTFPEVKL